MRSLDKSRIWRICYAICCLIYAAWVLDLSRYNFDLVHRNYRLAENQLQPERIEEIALQKLVDQCRKESKRTERLQPAGNKESVATEDDCLTWPTAVLAERQHEVKNILDEEKSRAVRKLVTFYVFFGVVFLILPPLFLYLLVTFFIWVFRNIKFIR